MTLTPITPVGAVIKTIRPIPLPGPVMDDLMPLPGPQNGGIVPPWLEGVDLDLAWVAKNTIAEDDPGWGLELYDPTDPNLVPDDPDTPVIMGEGNPGIVPPWLQ